MAKFSEVLTIVNGRNQKQVVCDDGKYPIYGSGGIMGYANDYICKAETVVIGRKGSINKPIFAETPFWNVDTAFGLYANSEKLNSKYLYYFCEKFDFEKLNTTVTIPSLTKSNLLNVEIPLPNLEKQKQIVELLDKVTSLIFLRKQQLSKLDELVKARFVEMFGDSVANTKNFPSTTLETVMTVFPQNGLYKPQTDYVQDDTGIPILRIDAFYNGKVTNWNTLKRLICSETEIDRYLLKENDIVINRVNSIEYLGKCAHIVGLKEKTVFESNMMRFHMDEKKVNAVYVTEVLCTEDIYRQILRRAKKSVNQASINQEDVKSLEILVPPLSLQNQFAAFVERVDQQKQTVQQSLEKLELMKKALMQEYFG
jgi:type I restriction enzyme, S subunit